MAGNYRIYKERGKMRYCIDYSKCKMDPRGVYILTYLQLENFVEEYLEKKHSEMLGKPQEVPIENWLDSGEFGFSLEYRNLLLPQAKGLTAFSKMVIAVRDGETGNIDFIPVEENTVVLDETEESAQSHFTAGHELAHILFHPYYFQTHVNALAAHAEFGSGSSPAKHPCFWLERQANYAAGALTMPRVTFLELYQSFFNDCLSSLKQKTTGVIKFIEEAAKIYNVSKSAVEIRLKQLDSLSGNEWER